MMTATSSKKSSPHVLIVEDDPFISDIYLVELENNGFKAQIASDGQEAIEKLKKHKYDLMLLDILMPHKDGFAVLREIKAGPAQSMPIIVLTNLAGREHVKKALDLGADDYIIKTQFTPQEVLKKIQETLKKTA